MKKVVVPLFLLAALLLVSVKAIHAAAPDGAGPWADQVINFSQGLTKGGAAIGPSRSDASQALGAAENTIAEGTFVSLGFGGSLTLQFDNAISNGVFVVESTNPDYPIEHAQVDLSADGTTWYSAGTVDQSGTVSQPDNLACAQYVRITDTSNSADFAEDTADAYDVDGVQATEGEACTIITPTPTQTVCRDNENCVTPTPTVTPDPTATPTQPPSNGGSSGGDGQSDGKSDGGSSCPECTQAPASSSNVLGASTEAGQVLGASTDTLAATGTQQMVTSILVSMSASVVVLTLGLLLASKKV